MMMQMRKEVLSPILPCVGVVAPNLLFAVGKDGCEHEYENEYENGNGNDNDIEGYGASECGESDNC